VRDTLTRWMGRRLFLGIGFFDDPVSLVIRMILACHLTRIAHSRRNAQLWQYVSLQHVPYTHEPNNDQQLFHDTPICIFAEN
jgi:hypothetical protein